MATQSTLPHQADHPLNNELTVSVETGDPGAAVDVPPVPQETQEQPPTRPEQETLLEDDLTAAQPLPQASDAPPVDGSVDGSADLGNPAPSGQATAPGKPAQTKRQAEADGEAPGQPEGEHGQERPDPKIRKVGPPGVVVEGPLAGVPGQATGEGAEGDEILEREKPVLTPEEAEEILGRVPARDLARLDREVDRLYEQVVQVMSGEREANVAFEALRRVRQMLLLEPEQYAEAEFLVQQIRAKLNRIEQSATAGRHYGPRLLIYQVVWLIVLTLLAIVTTAPGSTVGNLVGYWLRLNLDAAGGVWVTLLISTLAWGGIGGVTSALWSLHYHISVARDYDPVENLWYLTQPLLGMVLGGIVYLIMASGFLVVQADLSQPDAALGAKLLPAAVAVVAGFRQTMVLDLIERVVKLLAPGENQQG